ncbi:DUF3262 family protein [Thalassotalea ganghwensis]
MSDKKKAIDSDSPEKAFEVGAGYEQTQLNGLFTEMTVFSAFMIIGFIIITAYVSWRNDKLSFASLGSVTIKGIFLIVLFVTAVGVISTTATFK